MSIRHMGIAALLAVLTVTAAMAEVVVRGLYPNSDLDRYLHVLELSGRARTSQMHYRDRATSRWEIPGDHPWAAHLRPTADVQFSADLYSSYNSSHPHGGNDGSLWQGRGFNALLVPGVMADYGVVSARLFPELSYAQNLEYPVLPSGTGAAWGNYRASPDAPQRFGDAPLTAAHAGDSELRVGWGAVAVSIGTPHAWLGPAQRNAIMLSTHAPGHPRVTLSVMPTETRIGRLEVHAATGLLRESDYFDQNTVNDLRSNSFLTASWQPFFIPNFTIGFQRSLLGRLDDATPLSVATTIFNPSMAFGGFGTDDFDQRASITFDWRFPQVGFGVYGEWAKNDYSPGYRYWVRAPEHSQGYTLGVQQVIPTRRASFVHLVFELTQLVDSFDYLIDLGKGGTFYSHGIVRAGHSHRGQILGAAIGSGAISQYFGANWYTENGRVGFFINRHGRDQDYLYGNIDGYTRGQPVEERGIERVNAEMAYGVSALRWIGGFALSGELAVLHNINWNWIRNEDRYGVHINLRLARTF